MRKKRRRAAYGNGKEDKEGESWPAGGNPPVSSTLAMGMVRGRGAVQFH